MSFAESMRHSRRILNVSVSPHNVRQSARLLNYLASPDALVQHAVLASCAIPGMFRPVQLMTRKRGEIVPWMEHELWVDGSMNNDLPFAQLAQLLYISHFITSQANPHVIPFLSLHGGRHDVVASVAQMSGNLLMGGATQVLDVARKHAPTRALREVSSTAHAMSSQRYVGADMHIQIPFKPLLMARLLKNPSFEQFKEYIRLGEQATWPRLPMIRDRTRISRVFGDCIGLLMRRIAAAAPLPSQTPPRVRRRPRSPARPGSGS